MADYGKLLLQSAFSVWMERKKERIRELRFKPRSRYIFLYEQLVLFTKKYGRDDNPSYAFKNALKVSIYITYINIIAKFLLTAIFQFINYK